MTKETDVPSPVTDESRIKKIQDLLATAESFSAEGNEAAAETYREKANSLIVMWEIDEARLSAEGSERLKTEKIIISVGTPYEPVSYGYELACVGARVAEALGLRGLLTKTSTRDKRGKLAVRDVYKIVGFESDVRRAELLIGSLVTQCLTGMSSYVREQRSNGYASGWRYMNGTDKFQAKRGFIQGFSFRVADRLRELRERQVADTQGTGTDLVLVDKKIKVEEFVAETMKVGKSRARSYDGEGAWHGQRHADRADIGQSRFGQAARGALGGS